MSPLRVSTSALLLFLALSVSPALAIKVNTPAPDFTLKDLRGQHQTLSALRGKVVILNFWSAGCGPCVAEIPSLNETYRQFKAEGLAVLGVSIDTSTKPVSDLIARLCVEYPNLVDSDQVVYFDSYGLFGQPVSVIVDRRGVVREKIIGAVEWTSPAIKAKIQGYLKGR